MAKLVDALGSGPSGGNTVEVRVLFWAPGFIRRKSPETRLLRPLREGPAPLRLGRAALTHAPRAAGSLRLTRPAIMPARAIRDRAASPSPRAIARVGPVLPDAPGSCRRARGRGPAPARIRSARPTGRARRADRPAVDARVRIRPSPAGRCRGSQATE